MGAQFDLLNHQWHALWDYCPRIIEDPKGKNMLLRWGRIANAWQTRFGKRDNPPALDDDGPLNTLAGELLLKARDRARELGCADPRAYADTSKTYKPEGYKAGLSEGGGEGGGAGGSSMVERTLDWAKDRPGTVGGLVLAFVVAYAVGRKVLK